MAGFRTFATGEVLTAANVNDFLMKQSVMVFADATARTAALGTDVVEGMLTYNEDTAQLEVFDGTNFVLAAPAPPAGIGSNVVQTVKTDVFTASVAGGATTSVTGLTATITPTSSASKVLVTMHVLGSSTDILSLSGILTRGGSPIAVGDAEGVRSRLTTAGRYDALSRPANVTAISATFLDAPTTTSPITYGVDLFNSSGITRTIVVNRTIGDTDSATAIGRLISSIIAIEVAA